MIVITKLALDLVRPLTVRSEGLKLRPYKNPHDVWTQGYGHTSGINANSPICTPVGAAVWLDGDLTAAGHAIVTHVTHDLSNHQIAALLDFIFNLGSYNFDTSTLLKDINANKASDIPFQFSRWVHDSAGNILSGLVTRRTAEISLFETPD